MSKSIDTLVDDIYKLFDKETVFAPSNVEVFGQKLAVHIANRISEERSKPTLRLSNIGKPCERELWYSINTPEWAEPLPPQARMKFLFGDILEELLLFLAAEAGHKVEGQQDEIEINGVKGHRDGIIDGRVVDVKSASSFAFKKFADHRLPDDDPFGYMDQLGAYVSGSSDDPKVTDKGIGSFLVIDKQLGHITLDTYQVPDVQYSTVIDHKRKVIAQPKPPERPYTDEPEGKSGNRGLSTKCSYCAFKHKCWPGLRTFIYSNGPSYLTHVERLPKVPEVNAEGNVVHQF